MHLASSAFSDGGSIPNEYTCDGADKVPPLTISSPPKDTASFVLIMDDPDSPSGHFLHWLVYDIPGDARSSSGRSGKQGLNSGSRPGYGGPWPGSGEHRYHFRLYALDKMLDIRSGASRIEVEHAMKNHVIAETALVGKYMKMENR